MNNLIIRQLRSEETPPMHLLSLADPSKDMICDYIARGHCVVAEIDGEVVGEYVLLGTHPKTVELMNVAVAEHLQGRGIGKRLVEHAIQMSRNLNCQTLELGTGNSSIGQLALYQKCGFRVVGVDLDFFTRHYPEPIFENGIHCRDMIRLVFVLC